MQLYNHNHIFGSTKDLQFEAEAVDLESNSSVRKASLGLGYDEFV